MIEETTVPKNKKNDFADFYFRDAESILKAAKPSCLKYGLYIGVTKEVVKIDDRFYIKATATITDGKDSLTSVAYAREPLNKPKMDESQTTGSASSYAKKYALSDLLMIDNGEDDPDTKNNTETKKESDTQQNQTNNYKASEKQINFLQKLVDDYCKIKNTDFDRVADWLFKKNNVTNIQAASSQVVSAMIKEVTKMINDTKPTQQNTDISWGQK